ncbi:hypothetical protein RhiJN_18611 [Ceratobasidium sp. AG-Ba]|nr:hypothetical protein RhiJN_18611 [Ceratobasidium sp. AG-Ba]
MLQSKPFGATINRLPSETLLQIMITLVANNNHSSSWRSQAFLAHGDDWRYPARFQIQARATQLDVPRLLEIWVERVRRAPSLGIDLAIIPILPSNSRILWNPKNSRDVLYRSSQWCFTLSDILPQHVCDVQSDEPAVRRGADPLVSIMQRTRYLKLHTDRISAWTLFLPSQDGAVSAPYLESLTLIHDSTRHPPNPSFLLPEISLPKLRSLALTCAPWFVPAPGLTTLQLGRPYALAAARPSRFQSIALSELMGILHECKHLTLLEIHLPLNISEHTLVQPTELACKSLGVSGGLGAKVFLDSIRVRQLNALYVHVDHLRVDRTLEELHTRSASPTITEFRYVSNSSANLPQFPLSFTSRLHHLVTLTLVEFAVDDLLAVLDDPDINEDYEWSGANRTLEILTVLN